MNDIRGFLQVLYCTLRQMKGCHFHSNDYKWRLGTEVINELKLGTIYSIKSLNEPRYLYGIEIEIDYKNPRTVRLFEDITNKIYISSDKIESEVED